MLFGVLRRKFSGECDAVGKRLKRFRAGVEIDFRQISEECYGAVEKKLKS
jgi:hypothetical protein